MVYFKGNNVVHQWEGKRLWKKIRSDRGKERKKVD